jgi:hypothetical protein
MLPAFAIIVNYEKEPRLYEPSYPLLFTIFITKPNYSSQLNQFMHRLHA